MKTQHVLSKRFGAILAAIAVLLPAIGHSAPIPYAPPTIQLETPASFDNVPQKSGALTVAYLPPATKYNFYLNVGEGIQNVALAGGHTYLMRAPQDPTQHQVQAEMIQEMIERKVDAIILATEGPAAQEADAPFIKQAIEQGIVVVMVNFDQLAYPYQAHGAIGVSQRRGTKKTGELAAQLLGGKPMNVGLIEGEPSYFSTERLGGFVDGLAGANMTVAGSVNGHWDTPGGYNATLALMKEHPEINVIAAANDFEIIGAASALETLKRNDVLLFGYDGVPDAISRIAAGKIAGTILADSYQLGQVAMQVVIDSLQGRFRGGFVENPTVLITQANAKEYLSAPEQEALATNLKEITVVSEPLPGLTNEDGTGLYWDILRAIYEPQGMTVNIRIVPLKRALVMIEDKTADAMLGHYRGDSKDFIFPQWHYSAQNICAIFKKGRLTWNGQHSLVGKRVAWIRGADYDKYLSVPVNGEEKNDHIGPLLMVNADRIDVFLEDRAELLKTFEVSADRLKQDGFQHENFQIEPVLELKLYPAFADTPRGRKLAEIFDDRMPQLLSSGRLNALFEQWNFGTFPF